MRVLEFNVGDTAYIHNGGKGNPLKRGTVVHTFHYNNLLCYVVELPTSIDPILEIRTGCEMSDVPDRPIGMWRR